MKKKKKTTRIWSGQFPLKVVLDIIDNELSFSQAARKYNMYLSSGTLNDTLPARWVYQYRLYGKERFFQTPKDYRKNPARKFPKPSKEVEDNLDSLWLSVCCSICGSIYDTMKIGLIESGTHSDSLIFRQVHRHFHQTQ